MGNSSSSPRNSANYDETSLESSTLSSFPGGILVESALQCGNLDDEESLNDSNHGKGKKKSLAAQLLSHAENCVMSPQNSMIEEQNSDSDVDNGIRLKTSSEDGADHFFDNEYEELGGGRIQSKEKQSQKKAPKQKLQVESTPKTDNQSSALLAKSLMSEVGSPNAMSPNTMTQREKKLLKAQEKARQHNLKYGVSALKINSGNPRGVARPIGSPSEGVGQPSVLGSIAHAFTGRNDPISVKGENEGSDPSVLPPNSLSENRAAQVEQKRTASGRSPSPVVGRAGGKHTVTIGLSLSRRSSCGHPDTVTRQTAFDFNELQDREYKYVSSTDSSGWAAGGGEKGGNTGAPEGLSTIGNNFVGPGTPNENTNKVPSADTVHIPIIQIDAESSQAVDVIISALARGEIFIPHMAIIPEALSVNGVSPPDLVVRFGTERNEDLPPDEWPNWCLEFMHNQLYEYFHGMGARWMKRPFSITLAKKVRWKTVKHMNRYFSHAERVIDAWREKGPQYLDPQLAYVDGATPEEVARPHGIYLMRNGVPTNYFAPNFNPPYTTKMTRSLLFNVLGKSWDKKRREWTSSPIPKLITPSMLVSAMCGCSDTHASGFLATEATFVDGPLDRSTMVPAENAIRSLTPKTPKTKPFDPASPLSSQQKKKKKEQRKFEIPGTKSSTPVPMPPSQAKVAVSPASSKKDETTNEPLSPTLELNISSSSAEFFDGAKSDSVDIPTPPTQQESKKREARDPEPRKTVEPPQNTRQALEPQEQRQDRQKEKRPQDDTSGENDENSGDSKNHESGFNKDDKMTKKKVASDEEWLNDVVSFNQSTIVHRLFSIYYICFTHP